MPAAASLGTASGEGGAPRLERRATAGPPHRATAGPRQGRLRATAGPRQGHHRAIADRVTARPSLSLETSEGPADKKTKSVCPGPAVRAGPLSSVCRDSNSRSARSAGAMKGVLGPPRLAAAPWGAGARGLRGGAPASVGGTGLGLLLHCKGASSQGAVGGLPGGCGGPCGLPAPSRALPGTAGGAPASAQPPRGAAPADAPWVRARGQGPPGNAASAEKED